MHTHTLTKSEPKLNDTDAVGWAVQFVKIHACNP